MVDRLEEGGDRRREVGEREGGLGARVAADGEDRGLLKVLGAELEADGDSLQVERRGVSRRGEKGRIGGSAP